MGEVISVFEYDLLGSDKAASVGAKLVPPLVFNYLEALSLASNQGSQFLKLTLKWFTEFGHLNRGDMLTSEQHRCHNEKKKFQRRV